MRVLDIVEKPKETFIENADVLVVAGRGVKKPEDLKMLEKLADLLGGQLACTRPMVEAGWLDAKCQIGLSGRTVRPKTHHHLRRVRCGSVYCRHESRGDDRRDQ